MIIMLLLLRLDLTKKVVIDYALDGDFSYLLETFPFQDFHISLDSHKFQLKHL